MENHRRAAPVVRFFGRASFALGIALALGCASESPPAKTPDGSPPGGTGHAVHEKGGASVFVVNEVKDFDAFKKYLDEGSEERKQMGVLGYVLTRLDDGRVVMHFFAHDLKEVDAALKSPRMQDYFSREGAPDSSLVWLVEDELVAVPSKPLAGKTFSLFFKLKANDFPAFKKSFEDHAAVYAEQGVIAHSLHQSTVQGEIIVLHFVGTDHDKLAALPARSEFVELLSHAEAGSVSKPLVGEDVVRSTAP